MKSAGMKTIGKPFLMLVILTTMLLVAGCNLGGDKCDCPKFGSVENSTMQTLTTP
ncbi:MAG TPA: hypothetical protein PK742_00330 [Chitinophagales bacterium]|nr:hypothetical protein [Chitinophagales bacterium]